MIGSEPREVGDDTCYVMRSRPEDFVVDEEALYPASGEGKHTFLRIEKIGRTTEQVASEIARAAGIASRDVGYAGRKDRHAITRQWFSLPEVEPEAALEWSLQDARVLEAVRHPHKLKTGQLRGNRFEIILRGGPSDGSEIASAKARTIHERGLPNRFGNQRFGRDGENAARAREMLAAGRPPRDRRAARFLLSAYQSEVFNAVLEDRGEDYDSVVMGDVARVEESGGLFWVDDLDREKPRAAHFEISATGPIFGTKMRAPRDEAGERELAVFDAFGLPDMKELKLPKGLRARGGRRALRVRPGDLEIESLGEERGLRVRCGLPPGSYVTVLLEALVGEGQVRDAAAVRRSPDE